jgi:hypothetical protein
LHEFPGTATVKVLYDDSQPKAKAILLRLPAEVSLSLTKSLTFDSGVEGYFALEASSPSKQEVFMA